MISVKVPNLIKCNPDRYQILWFLKQMRIKFVCSLGLWFCYFTTCVSPTDLLRYLHLQHSTCLFFQLAELQCRSLWEMCCSISFKWMVKSAVNCIILSCFKGPSAFTLLFLVCSCIGDRKHVSVCEFVPNCILAHVWALMCLCYLGCQRRAPPGES